MKPAFENRETTQRGFPDSGYFQGKAFNIG